MKAKNSTLKSYLAILLFLLFTSGLNAGIIANYDDDNADDSGRFTHTISGTVTRLPGNVPFEGVVIVFSGVGTATVDATGFYTMQAPRNWSGTATPQFGNGGFYDFIPSHYSYTDLKFDQPNKNHTGQANTTFTISGQITEHESGSPFANKTINFLSLTTASPNRNVTTDGQGFYSIELLPSYNYEFEPKYGNFYYISPFTRSYSPLSANMTAQDYTYINYEYPIPPEWQSISSGFFHIISIENTAMPDICGRNLEIGDLIGVFHYDFNNELKCAGWTRWQDKTNMALIAQGDDLQTTPNFKEGFATNELMNWRVYSYKDQKTYPAQAIYKVGSGLLSNNRWQSMGLSIVQGIDARIVNSISIPQGWSGISNYVAPQTTTMATVMAPVNNQLIILQNLQGVYYPSAGINTIGNWAFNKGYVIKLNQAANLPITGCPNANKTIALAAGWNLIPVLSQCDVAVDDLFASVLNRISIIKEVAGTGIYWPAMGIQTLEVFKPGKAYYVAATQNTTVTYGTCDEIKNGVFEPYPEPDNTTGWNMPVKTPNTHIIALGTDIANIAKNGDFIGAFTNSDFCAGIVQLNERETNNALVVFGNDVSTEEQDGFQDEENIKLRLFNSLTGEIFDLEVEYDTTLPVWSGKFQDNGLSAIKTMKFAATGIESKKQQRVMVYPNPAKEMVTFSTLDDSNFLVSLQHIGGKTMLKERISGKGTIDLSQYSRGIYIVKIENEHSTTYEKLVLK